MVFPNNKVIPSFMMIIHIKIENRKEKKTNNYLNHEEQEIYSSIDCVVVL